MRRIPWAGAASRVAAAVLAACAVSLAMPARSAGPAAASAVASAVAAPLTSAASPASPTADPDDPRAYVEFVQEPSANCVARNGLQILVRNRHPSRALRVWLDRYHMGTGTGDRSRSELKPGAEPEPLGCSRSTTGVQEWRIARAAWVP